MEHVNIGDGSYTDFYGHAIHHQREKPVSDAIKFYPKPMGKYLPFEGEVAGMTLMAMIPEEDLDPVCLYDRWGKILYQWPDNYFPSLTEIREIASQFI